MARIEVAMRFRGYVHISTIEKWQAYLANLAPIAIGLKERKQDFQVRPCVRSLSPTKTKLVGWQ